ncbi:hypothetical protein AX15_001912 [Amanita polypyramis BW_CC]|nr:hypothetical protein AX15_001912 [Amanita polypyramis BW_CC]
MLFYSRKSRQPSPDQADPAGSGSGNSSGDNSNIVAGPSNNHDNSTNKNSNPSHSSPSNPSQSARGVVNTSIGDTSSPSPNRRMSKDSEGYPSWLPKRPPPPAPASTFHSSMGVPDFNQEFGIIRNDREYYDLNRGPELVAQNTDGTSAMVHFGGRKPTPRSVRIVNLQDSYGDRGMVPGVVGQGKSGHPSYPHGHVHADVSVPPSPGPAGIPPVAQALSRAGGAGISAAAQAAAFSSPLHPRFNARGLHLQIFRSPSKLALVYFYLYPFLVFANVPLQTYFDFNAVFILVQVSKYPNPLAPGVPGSGRNWALGAAAYIACWLSWILIVTILYEIIYSFFRRWRIKRPAVMPLYLSSSAFNLVCMTSYTNFCFMQHLRLGAFMSERGSIRDGLAETFYFYSQNLPNVALLLPRAALSLALLLSYGSPLPGVVLNSTSIVTQRDQTFFSQDGSLSGYAKGVLIANAAWTAWRILVLLCSWMGVWILSGQGCAGLCGPRYRWEEEEVEKRRYSYLYGDAGSEDLGSTLAWSWRQCTRMRIQYAFEFCLTTERPAVWAEKKGGTEGMEGDGVAQVMAAIAFPSAPQPIRRSVLSGDLFEDPNGGLGSVLPKVMKRPSKEGHQLSNPYPFTASGAQISSADKMVPFPHSPSASGREERNPSSAATSGSTEEVEVTENPTTSSGKTRESGSLSSFGQPVSSRYPFQFRHPHTRNVRVPQRDASDSSSPDSVEASSTSAEIATDSTESSASQMAQSSESVSSSSSDESSRGNIPMPPRHPQQAEGRSRPRRRQGSAPAMTPATSSTMVPPVVFPRTQTTEPATMDTVHYEEQRHRAIDDDQSIVSSHSEDDSVGLLSPASARSPRPSLIASVISGIRGNTPASRTQSQSSAVSSGTTSSSPPSSSARSHLSSFGSVNVSVVGTGARGPVRSRTHSRVRGGGARTRASSASAYVRSRAQSLMQGIGAASQSSIELVQNVIRSRTNSMMVRLDEGEHEHEGSNTAGNTLRVPRSHPHHRTSNVNDELDVHDNDENEIDDGAEFDERISGLYDAQQQHADISYYSDDRTHSRSGSGSTGAMTSSNENYTFGQPFPHRTRLPQMDEGQTVMEEREQDREEGQRSRASSQQSVVLGDTQQATPDNSSSSSSSTHSHSSRQATRPSLPVPAALSPMRPRTYHTAATAATAAEAASLYSSPPDMISTAAASFVTGSATVEGSTTESSTFGTGGALAMSGGEHRTLMGSDMVDRPDPTGASWRPA